MSANARERLVAMLPRLRAFAFSLARSRNDADDLVQATCERALNSLDRLEPAANFEAWLLRILRNLWIDRFRKSRREVVSEPGSAVFDARSVDGAGAAEAKLTLSDAQRAIGDLPEEQREVLNLVCVLELSYREASEILDIPLGTVMSRLARARKAVADRLGLTGADANGKTPEPGSTGHG